MTSSGSKKSETQSSESIIEIISRNQVLIGGQDEIKKKIIELDLSDDIKILEKYHHFLSEIRIKIGTLLKTDHVSFLFGAGTSVKAGGVLFHSIPLEIELRLLKTGIIEEEPEEWLSLLYKIFEVVTSYKVESIPNRLGILEKALESGEIQNGDIAININFEKFLDKLYRWQAAIVTNKIEITFNENTLEIEAVPLENLIRKLTIALVEECKLPKPNKEKALSTYHRFLQKVLTRPLNLHRVNIFTLNYDTLVEQAADAKGAVLIDGFVGSLQRVFRPESFNQDIYYPAQTTEGRVHRLDRVVHLYKLHGSVTWYRVEEGIDNPYGLFATFEGNREQAEKVIIYPTPLKTGDTLGLPYSELFRHFASKLTQPQSVLFVIGYGFNDEHVNSHIWQALSSPSFKLIIVNPDPKHEFVKQLEEVNDERIWIIKGWGDKSNSNLLGLGTFEGFVEHLLPDLREEKIRQKVVDTHKKLDPRSFTREFKDEKKTDDQ